MFKSIKFNRIYLLCLAFTSGLTIMAIEISASRLLAPYYGSSTFVWTNIIGVIMLALAIGYYLGGKLADKRPEVNILLKLILFACFLLLSIPFFIQPLTEIVSKNILFWQSATILIFIGSLVIVSLLFFLPILILGSVSPFIIKLLSQSNDEIGKNAGMVFSISTIGSILGTFLPVLIFIPYLGTRKTIIIFSLLLIVITLLGLIKKKSLLIVFVFILPFNFFKLPAIKADSSAIYENESVYQYFQVVDRENYRYLKINEGLGVFSVLNKDPENFLTNTYYDFYNILPYIDGNEQNQNILILGLAGGTISTQLSNFFANKYNLNIDGVEIDKKLIEAGNSYFNLKNSSLTIYNLDGRNFLDYSAKNYNSIIIDVYSNQLYIPFQLTTKEFFESVKNHLSSKGVVAMNVNATSPNSKILKAITNTMLLVFNNVYTVQQEKDSWNFMVLAADNELNFKELKSLNEIQQLDSIIDLTLENVQKISYDKNSDYLIDDKAPIEYLTDWMIIDYLYKNL